MLPNSVCREKRGIVYKGSVAYVPLFCANCGADGGFATQETLDALGDYAFYLCDGCEAHGQIPGFVMVPMEVYWAKVREAQLEHEGRLLTDAELERAIDDPNHYLNLVARERPNK